MIPSGYAIHHTRGSRAGPSSATPSDLAQKGTKTKATLNYGGGKKYLLTDVRGDIRHILVFEKNRAFGNLEYTLSLKYFFGKSVEAVGNAVSVRVRGVYSRKGWAVQQDMKEAKASAQENAPEFKVELDTLAIDKARLSFTDLSTRVPFRRTHAPVVLLLTCFTTAGGKQASLKVTYASKDGEKLLVDGGVSRNPLVARLSVKAEAIDIRPVQPYLDGIVNVINN